MIANLAEPDANFPTGLGFLREMKKADGGHRKNYFRGMMPLMFSSNTFFYLWAAGGIVFATYAGIPAGKDMNRFGGAMMFVTSCLLPMPVASIFTYPINTIGVRMSLDDGRV